MDEFAKLISLTATFTWPFAMISFAVATIWGAIAYAKERTTAYWWLIGIALNIPSLFLIIRILTARQLLPSDLEHQVLVWVVFFGVGASGAGWFTGNIIVLLIHLVIVRESVRHS